MSKTLIHGGTVLVCDGVTAAQEAIVLDDGRVAGVGTEVDMRAVAGSGADSVDVQGATVMPGFIDSHSHLVHFGAWDAGLVDITDVRDHDDIVARVKARAEQLPAGQWIFLSCVGEPYYFVRRSYRDLVEGELPDRYVLDRATDRHPVCLIPPGPRVPDAAAFNSVALQALGITHLLPERVCDVWIDKDEHGTPTGLCYGSVTQVYNYDPFWLQVLKNLPPPPDSLWEFGIRFEEPRRLQRGVTSGYEGHCMDFANIAAYQSVRAAGELKMRCYATYDLCNPLDPYYRPTREQLIADMQRMQSMTDLDDDMLKINGVCVGRSGPCWPGLMRTRAPYRDPYGRLTTGRLLQPKWVEEEAVKFCVENDLRLNLVLAVPLDYEDFYDSVEPHLEQYNRKERDWIIQHAIIIRDSDIRRLGAMGCRFTSSKGFGWGKGEMYAERIGKHIWKDLVPFKRYMDADVPVSGCCDWGPASIFKQIQIAETCELAGSGHCLSQHAITREQALLMWTRDAARVIVWDGVGTLQAGNHADLIVVDQNPLTCDIEALPDTKVVRTMVGGATAYDGGQL